MWQGQQPPGGEQNQRDQSQNPYQQSGYQQPNPYGQQAPWNAPTVPGGPGAAPPEPPRGGGDGRKARLIAIVAAGAVVVAAGVTGFLVLGGDKDDTAKPDPTRSASGEPSADASDHSNPRTGDDGEPEPTVPGWKVVINPKRGLAFDVPPGWALESRDWAGGVVKEGDETETYLAAFAAPAFYQRKWCATDEDKDGRPDYTSLASAGTRGNRGVKSTEQAARNDATMWVYGAYTQPDKEKVTTGAVESYTTKSGLKGSLASASSAGVDKQAKCASDGKATVFAFKDSGGEFASWSFHGAKGVKDEVPDATVRKILSTVREYDVRKD
ncbi:hypothetical protein [Streptomyces kanamyceticus]|uniref:DUF8017 domain-containing protein n=1 Tax=Streptomyces kanamyceticus TaxID=1967 RepID=A0A5J6GPI4_STRKN|nr:hypothetical protein [Streptomyces kanamyceticus]QEU95915.1 hypothetical protein CP970_37795 [Streptomyces kanamyceticus]